MNRKLKKELKSVFAVPEPTRKTEFLNTLGYPKATNFEFYLSQLAYIHKRFWCLSVLLMIGLLVLAQKMGQEKEIVGLVSAVLPLLTLTGINEISKSFSYHMTELEMSCKYNLNKLTLIRLTVIGVFHISLCIVLLLFCKDQTRYGAVRYALYAITPFFLSSYVSLWMINHLKSKETLTVCRGVTVFISFAVYILSRDFTLIYKKNYTTIWAVAFLMVTMLLIKEMYRLLKERNEQWRFA